MDKFSIAVLCYGPHPQLAYRCVSSLLPALNSPAVADVHLCVNAVVPATMTALRYAANQMTCPVFFHVAEENACKYPMLRQVLRNVYCPLGENLMWFDDDTIVAKPDQLFSSTQAQLDVHPVAGRRQRIQLHPNQAKWLNQQDWSKRQLPWTPVPVYFPAGGWWAAKTEFLLQHDWPHPLLYHRGGDVMLGVLLSKLGLTFGVPDPMPVWINAAKPGEHHTQQRRGHDHQPLGCVLPPPAVPSTTIRSYCYD